MKLFCPLCGGKLQVGTLTNGMKGPCSHCGKGLEAVLPDEDPAAAYFRPVEEETSQDDEEPSKHVEDSPSSPKESAPMEDSAPVEESQDLASTQKQYETAADSPVPQERVEAIQSELKSVSSSSAFQEPTQDPQPTGDPIVTTEGEDQDADADSNKPSGHSCPHCGGDIDIHLTNAGTSPRKEKETEPASSESNPDSKSVPEARSALASHQEQQPRRIQPIPVPEEADLKEDSVSEKPAEKTKFRRSHSQPSDTTKLVRDNPASQLAPDYDEERPVRRSKSSSGGNTWIWLVSTLLLLTALLALIALLIFKRDLLFDLIGR